MLSKTHKFVTVFMVVLLVLGLALVACATQKPAETEQPAAPPAQEQPAAPPAQEQPAAPPAQEQPAATPGQLSYKAKTYTNSQYGFSIQYKDEWEAYDSLVTGACVAAFGVPASIPGVSLIVEDADAPVTADWIEAATNSLDSTSGAKVTDLKDTTLFDGTPAVEYTLKYMFTTYEIKAFGVSTDKNGKRIRAVVWTIDAFSPYDEALFSEIAHTLSVK